ncbi:hypothetical protein OU798_20740 [Prolixibacteraceae bacterium Z1-6]|uniref:Bacteriocin n=1 Tax=Draconibacterium aestuarii TaxID=2998507 RepID=A0A9X3J882_9BACT|nr:hypothetical protein [Prolixibacteraceae bacterium Z1-6]
MKTQENILDILGFDVLSSNEMNEVRGGIEPPKSRDKDVFDYDE